MDRSSSHFLIRNLLRILTPEEIDELVVMNLEEEKISLSLILMNKLDGIDEFYEKGHVVMPTINEKDDKNKKKSSNNDEIGQIKNFHQAIDTYKKSAATDITDINPEQEKKFHNGKRKRRDPGQGVLVNKKQS